MIEKEFYRKLEEIPLMSKIKITWDRGNGPLELSVLYRGINNLIKTNTIPRLYIKESKTYLDIEKIGGYNSIISIKNK